MANNKRFPHEFITDFERSLGEAPLYLREETLTDIRSFSFEGEDNSSAAAYEALSGTEYAVCSTTQFGYIPSGNSTAVTVGPASTDVQTQTKTPEQMQQEAENNGWLTIWHEFMWWYPWYRLHVQVFEVGQMMFDIGMSILPFGDVFDFAEEFHQIVEFFSERIIGPIVIPMIVAESVSIIAASASAGLDIAVLLVATWLAKGAAIVAAWNDVGSLGSVFLGIFVPMFFTALTKGGDMLMTLLQLLDGVKTLAEIAFGRVYRLASFIANMVITSVLLKRLDEMGAF